MITDGDTSLHPASGPIAGSQRKWPPRRVARLAGGDGDSRQCSSDQTGTRPAVQAGQSAAVSPARAGSGSTGRASGTTRSPACSNGNTSHPLIRDSGSRPPTSAAFMTWA
jgi:hypothetical protein